MLRTVKAALRQCAASGGAGGHLGFRFCSGQASLPANQLIRWEKLIKNAGIKKR